MASGIGAPVLVPAPARVEGFRWGLSEKEGGRNIGLGFGDGPL